MAIFRFLQEYKVSFAATRVAQKLGYAILKSEQLEVCSVVNTDVFGILPWFHLFATT